MHRKTIILAFVELMILSLIGFGAWTLLGGSQKPEPSRQNSSTSKQAKVRDIELSLYYVSARNESGDNDGRCGDDIVKVSGDKVNTDDGVKAAFDRLLSNRSRNFGATGLYNPLSGSELAFKNWSMTGTIATIDLTGTLRGGDMCENGYILQQLERTAVAMAGAEDAVVRVNGTDAARILQRIEP